MVSTPKGRLSQKIQAQDRWSTMTPPASGPMTAEVAQTLAIMPCARPRSSSLYRSPITVIVTGVIAPAPRPCSSRNRISDPIDQAKPHSTDPARNSAVPPTRTGLRPNTSDILP